MHGGVGPLEPIAHCRKRTQSIFSPTCAPIDRIGFDRKARFAKDTDRPRHVKGRCHQQPALARLRPDDRLGKDRILERIARTILKGDATFAMPRPSSSRAANLASALPHTGRKQNAGIGIASCQFWHNSQPFGRLIALSRYGGPNPSIAPPSTMIPSGARAPHPKEESDLPGG